MRIFMVWLLPLVLPFVVWWLWARFVARKQEELGPGWSDAPYAWLIVCAVLLCGASVATFGSLNASPASAVYQPAHMENGEFVPGRMVEPPKAP
ncbi:DUF6111 family protein [Zavarzinia sp. CC-PAN008]|uniref:DUF6111 family protein n=1 Tax=Zavarzinia sp. CC-PAN008 TaxID=3243332 RepID=UPI003F742B11